MIDHRINFLEDRLSRLERQNLFWKRVAIIPLLLMTSILLMGQVGRNHKVIEAEKFVIKDATGKTRVVLGLGPQPFSYGYGPDVYGVSLYASDGRHVASLSELAEGTGGNWREISNPREEYP